MDLRSEQRELLHICTTECSLVDLIARLRRTDRTKFRKTMLEPLIQDGLIELTIPEKPTSKHQRYRITPAGMNLLNETETREDP